MKNFLKRFTDLLYTEAHDAADERRITVRAIRGAREYL
jgi:hypothetical protein